MAAPPDGGESARSFFAGEWLSIIGVIVLAVAALSDLRCASTSSTRLK
jgi:hypothetical protein